MVENYWTHLPVGYVGMLHDVNVNGTLFQLLSEYYTESRRLNADGYREMMGDVNASAFHMRYRHQKDDARFKKGAHAQNVEISQLSDDDVRLVCEIYCVCLLSCHRSAISRISCSNIIIDFKVQFL